MDYASWLDGRDAALRAAIEACELRAALEWARFAHAPKSDKLYYTGRAEAAMTLADIMRDLKVKAVGYNVDNQEVLP